LVVFLFYEELQAWLKYKIAHSNRFASKQEDQKMTPPKLKKGI